MVTVVVFWSSVMAVIFFLTGMVCKTLLALIEGGIKAVIYTLKAALVGAALIISLYLIMGAVNNFLAGTLWSAVGNAVLAAFLIFFIVGILGSLGAVIAGFIISLLEILISVVSFLLMGMNSFCEKAYVYFLNVIIKRIVRY